MDKTLEIVITAAVLMMIAAVLFFMLSQGSSDVSKEADSKIDGSQCTIWKSQGQCGKASECGWTQSECEASESDSLNCAELSNSACISSDKCELSSYIDADAVCRPS